MKEVWFIIRQKWIAEKEDHLADKLADYDTEFSARETLRDLPINDMFVGYDLYKGTINNLGMVEDYERIAMKDSEGIQEF